MYCENVSNDGYIEVDDQSVSQPLNLYSQMKSLLRNHI